MCSLIQILQESYSRLEPRRGPTRCPTSRPPRWAHPAAVPAPGRRVPVLSKGSGTNAFVRSLVHALAELYELKGGEITEDNWAALDAEIRKRHADPGWCPRVMDRAGIRTAVSDPYIDPFMDVRATMGERYRSVLRINSFAFGWHPESVDHNGHNGQEMLGRLGIHPRTFDDYLQSLGLVLDRIPGLHKVALKNALAYDRSVNFDDVDESRARAAWGKRDPSPSEKKAFGDVVIDRLCRLAGNGASRSRCTSAAPSSAAPVRWRRRG